MPIPPILLASVAALTPLSAPCPGTTTPQVLACLGGELDTAERTLARYVAAARGRIGREAATASDAHVLAAFDRSQLAWLAYRDAECGAVAEEWYSGTIAPSFAVACNTRLTSLRTFVVWRDWLTYVDSTPPLLPRPALDTALGDRAP